ncbi:hypothetical protein [uncultured Sulfitobacter sp.]|uniref:hypothetical protein n=1 Tax=uncultured Sulfitobacter sp. TaxID=191468 RepID=UPI002601BB7D|nr:hypothetical protein [uncultured Sulfitobacter sp.]
MAKIEKGLKAKTAKAAKADGEVKKTGGRARRLEKIGKASTVTFTLERAVRKYMDAQAKAAGMNLTHYMQKLVENHVIDAAGSESPLARRLGAKREVIDRTVALAAKLDAEGKFDENFILTVVREADKDPDFMTHYEAALEMNEDDTAATVKRARVSLNQQIGRVIKKSVGARSKRNELGHIARGQVSDTFIATYTLLQKPSAPAAVA